MHSLASASRNDKKGGDREGIPSDAVVRAFFSLPQYYLCAYFVRTVYAALLRTQVLSHPPPVPLIRSERERTKKEGRLIPGLKAGDSQVAFAAADSTSVCWL